MPKFVFVAIAVLIAAVAGAQSRVRLPAMPSHGYVLDNAHLLSSGSVSQINSISNAVKQSNGVPIVVVTLESLSSMQATGWRMEDYATYLFNKWDVGSPSINKGVLILVSKGDRKARIELGADWAHSKDPECQAIMDSEMIPRFKDGDYDGGILQAVKGVDTLIRTGSSPVPQTDYSNYSGSTYSGSTSLPDLSGLFMIIPCIFVTILVLGIVSSVNRGVSRRYYGPTGYTYGYGPGYYGNPGCWGGSGGYWGGGGGGGFFSGGSSGGFSGGSDFSGGGSSGGGGASGSW